MSDSDATEEETPKLVDHNSDNDSTEEETRKLVDSSSETPCESSESDYVPPVRRRKKKKGQTTKNSPKCKSSTKRKSSAKPTKKRKRRKIIARNTTYASKQECQDLDAIKDFLENGDCGCTLKCIKKLKDLRDEGALDMVSALRRKRFECTCLIPTHYLHPEPLFH